MPHTTLVTGRLAESALRRVLTQMAAEAPFDYGVVVLDIDVAALMTATWVAKRLEVPTATKRVVLPGYCTGDLTAVRERVGTDVELGPKDLRDLPRHLTGRETLRDDYGAYDIEILAEINHAPRLALDEILAIAEHYRASGADVIDLGMVPGEAWRGVDTAVKALRDAGHRVSIDTFSPAEADLAAEAGAELWLSVHEGTLDAVRSADCEVVVIPQRPRDADWFESLRRSVEKLDAWRVPYRVDPIIEPIGLGFAASLERYAIARRALPDAEIMMGVGNLTELTDVDSAGINVLLAAFCQELGIRSVLTTEVIGWCRSAVRELDIARRLVHYACHHAVPPKHLDDRLLMLRDAHTREHGTETLTALAKLIRDRNFRIFAEGGKIHVMSADVQCSGTDPYELFEQMKVEDASHAFYLGYEMAKAVTALTLGKQYRQDEALDWGFLTAPETSHVERRGGRRSKRQRKNDP